MASQSLLDYNKENALSNILAMEEHLAGQSNNGISINSWCFKKHGLMAKNHHMMEMKTLLESEDYSKSVQIGQFMERFDVAMKRTNPSATEIRELRNEFREIINDPTMSQEPKKCGVCALDRRSKAQTFTPSINVFEPAASKLKESKSSKTSPLLIIGGVAIVGLIIYLAV